jgi:hypothetical protein
MHLEKPKRLIILNGENTPNQRFTCGVSNEEVEVMVL